MVEQEEKSLRDLLIDMASKKETVEDNKKKPWKMPWKGKLSKAKARKGYVTVIYLKDNRNMDFVRVPIDEQTTMVDGSPRIATADDVFYHRGKPVIIQPSWSVKPISITDNYEETMKREYGSQGYKLLLNRMKKEVLVTAKTIGSWAIILVVLAVGALAYFAWKGGYFK